jgi:FimV-like protein
MEFADQPNFSIAGVTDWTAVGGHGSDSTLRTSEALARETLTLKQESAGAAKDRNEAEAKLRSALAEAPGSFAANHQLGAFYLQTARYRESVPLLLAAYQIDATNRGNEYDLASAYEEAGDFARAREHVQKLLAQGDSADLHRLSGQLDEKAGDPLAAVHEDEQAVRLDPSEPNYFAWGSELLLHRAVWQAVEVFRNGTKAYPKSARMLAALGAALFAGDLYDEAAASLCAASDLNPADPEPYLFMGRIQIAAPKPLACVEPRLARFVEQQPASSIANYLYAMALSKQPPDPKNPQQVEKLLKKAVALDAKCADAYLQLGILSSSEHDSDQAIDFYSKAIEADPQLGEAHYRLGVAYDHVGLKEKAKREFELHDQIEALQAAAVERQRREVKQFLVVLEQPGNPKSKP